MVTDCPHLFMDWESRQTSIVGLLFGLHVTACLVFPVWGYLFTFTSAAVAGVSLGVWLFWVKHRPRVKGWSIPSKPWVLRSTGTLSGSTLKSDPSEAFKSRMLISKNVDVVVEEIIDNILRDNLITFYSTIVHDDKHNIQVKLKNELWIVASRFLTKVRSFDESFLVKDLVNLFTKHIKTVNDCLHRREKYVLYGHLKNEVSEKAFLQRITSVLLDILVSRTYTSIPVFKNLLQQILTHHVLFHMVDRLSDPDFINQTILEYFSGDQQSKSSRKTKYTYAETFDQFIAMIKNTNDVEELKRMRYYIVTEIMQASAINHLKHQRGLDVNRDKDVRGSSVKGDLLLARNLPRYMNQLRFAKKLCDKRMANMSSADGTERTPVKVPEKKVVYSFRSIMSAPDSRKYLDSFLKNTIATKGTPVEQTAHHLLSFWESVNIMKQIERVKQIEIAHELITYTYFINSINIHTKIPKEVLKDMEQFILGNCGPEAFFQTQKVVYKILEERYYPRYIVSKDYDEMTRLAGNILELVATTGPEEATPSPRKADSPAEAVGGSNCCDSSEHVVSPVREHITISEQTLIKLRESLSSKQDALTALTHSMGTSSQPTETTERIISKLMKEVDDIQDQISMREAHVARSLLWLQFLGQWRAEIYSIQTDDPDAGPMTAIIVHPGSLTHDMRCDAWVIARSTNEIVQLKRKLMKIKPSLTKIEIFRLKNVHIDGNIPLIKKAKESMNALFDAILTDPRCLTSEEAYLFFNSSPDNLRLPLVTLKSNKTSRQFSMPFANLFGFSSDSSSSTLTSRSNSEPGDEQDLTRFFEELEGKDQMKDDVAEPLYSLLNEVFDLEDNVSWLRKSLIAFVQVSYGKTINRQIRETVSWMTSEAMLEYYFRTFRDSFWPKDPVPLPTDRSEFEKTRTYSLAKHILLQNIPDFLVNLMGETSAKQGTLKLFELAQNRNLNKQLIYGFIELFMFSFIPELKQFYPNTEYEAMLNDLQFDEASVRV